jgi:histidyl-tRNA synthetase
MASQKVQRPKGTQDITPHNAAAWQHMHDVARSTLEAVQYRLMQTPIFEATELFCRGVGESTDIVNKEMYSFEKSNRALTLRPEGTAGVVRAYIENNFTREANPQRFYYIGPMFRYERPQEGRQRQFHQIGAELFGLNTPASDAESIITAWELLNALGIPDVRLEINTVGDTSDRPAFREALQNQLKPHLPELCEDCQRRFSENPLRMLDCKVPTCQAIYQGGAIDAFLNSYQWSNEAMESFNTLKEILTGYGVPFTQNPRLVRGLDYYSRTVFEFITDKLGAQGTVCGGGRYNGLVEQLGGTPTPAIGWAMGVERLMKLMPPIETPLLDAYIVTDCHTEAFKLAQRLRATGQQVEVDISGKNFGKQFQLASKRGAQNVYTLGQEDVLKASVSVKNFQTGETHTVPLS